MYANVPEVVTIEEDGQPLYRIAKTGMRDTGKFETKLWFQNVCASYNIYDDASGLEPMD